MGIIKSYGITLLQQIRNRVPATIYGLRDDFLTPLLPGAITGTIAEPGPSDRTVVDTTNVMSIAAGQLTFNGNNAAGDPGIWYDAETRDAGLILSGDLQIADVTQICEFGFDANQAGALTVNAYRISADTLLIYDSGALGPSVYIPLDSTEYKFAIVLRSTGAYYFWKDNGNWELLWISDTDSTATIYPGISNNSVLTGEFGNIFIPKKTWLPLPVLSDGFGSVNEPDAIDYGGVNDGDIVRVGLGGDARKAFFDGTNSYCNIYSTDLNNKFDGSEGTVIVRPKVSAAGVWADAQIRWPVNIQVDGNNYNGIAKLAGANTLYYAYNAGGVLKTVILGGAASTDLMTLGQTWSLSADEFIAYYNGAQTGLTQNALGAWVGNLSATTCCVGSINTTPIQIWDGWVSDAIVLYGVVATPAQMSDIHTHLDAGTMTESWLNSTFGAGTWSWWKLNESFESDGSGHAEGIAGGIGSGGDGLLYEQPVGAFDYNGNTLHCSFQEALFAFMVADCKTADVLITADLTRSASNVGVVTRYTDSNNHLDAYHNGANAVLREYVGGVGNVLINVVAAYGAGNPIRLILDGTATRLYYNDVLIGTAVVDSSLTGTKHGAFSAAVDNTIDNLTVYARGTSGEYEILESF